MPIVYDKESKGWKLLNPSEDELLSLEKMAIEYITSAMGKMAAIAFARMCESGTMPDGVISTDTEEKVH